MNIHTSQQRVLVSCLVTGAVLCICLSLVSLAGAGTILFGGSTLFNTAPQETSQPLDVDAQMRQIEAQIAVLRGLEPKTGVVRKLLTPAELRQHVLDNFLQDYTSQDAAEDARVLWVFGLLDKDFNLYDFYVELYSEQIAGYYDQETQEMFVVQGEGFMGPERLTYAHEFTHALQDQHYDIEKRLRYNDDDCKNESERCTALSALLEGDASLTESLWFSSHATLSDQRELSEFYSTYQSPVYDSSPPFMQEDFLFPYQQGKDFVESLYQAGGWEAVDQAYLNPPLSSEQILHPERYPEDAPAAVSLSLQPADLSAGWEEIDRGVMGEWYTSLVLFSGLDSNGRIDRGLAQRAAAGWEGDAYAVFYNPGLNQTVMALLTEWEDEAEAQEFARAFQEYARQRFGPPEGVPEENRWVSDQGVHQLTIRNATTAWILAPTAELADQIWATLTRP